MTREEVKMAFREAIASEYDPVLAKHEGANTAFSQEFLDKMDRLIKKNRNPLWHMANTAAKRIVLILILGLITLFSLEAIPEVRANTLNFIKKVFSTHAEFSSGFQYTLPNEKVIYEITEVPDGFYETARISNGSSMHAEYMNQNGNVLFLEQKSSSGAIEFTVDAEHGTLTEVLLNGKTAHLYKRESILFLYWIEDDMALTLANYGQLTEEEFLRIAASVKKPEQYH